MGMGRGGVEVGRTTPFPSLRPIKNFTLIPHSILMWGMISLSSPYFSFTYFILSIDK